ncbi:hypothetical protein [Streptomyces swartbergensis]
MDQDALLLAGLDQGVPLVQDQLCRTAPACRCAAQQCPAGVPADLVEHLS